MDFFDREDHARRQTVRLLVLFALAVAVIIAAIYLVTAAVTCDLAASHGQRIAASRDGFPGSLWNPPLLAAVSLGTLLVITLGSLYKISELASGGEGVALMMGGRAIDPQTADPAERRLLNVVEEMSLAAGIPVPPVFVLAGERGINAFAAGYQPGNAVVAVSRGSLDYLTRDELQGVLGHEFSHVLNGDMRLNLRLVAVVYGILVMSIVGYYIMRSAGSSSRGSGDKGGGGAIFVIGLSMWLLGYLGILLGQIIRSAISRQREFLADASSVQFTRNPEGLAGALKKIGGLAEGSRIRSPQAHEFGHMFFGDAAAGSLLNLFATHPPLVARIKLLEPGFDGRFPEVKPIVEGADGPAAVDDSSRVGRAQRAPPSVSAAAVPPHRITPADLAVLALAGDASRPPVAPGALRAQGQPVRAHDTAAVLPRIGQPQAEHLEHAGRLMAGMPQSLIDAGREPFTARAVVYALLLCRDDPPARERQLQLLAAQLDPPLLSQTRQLAQALGSLPPASRLPLADLTVPALKRIGPQQYAAFRRVVEALSTAHGRPDLFEYCLRVVLLGYLDVQFGLRKPPAVRYRSVAAVAGPALTVLSSVAYAGPGSPDDIRRAVQAGAAVLAKADPQGERWAASAAGQPLPHEQCTLAAFDAALGQLAQAGAAIKRAVISALVATIGAEGKMTLEESELLRAVAAALACPVPPELPPAASR